MLTHHRNVLEAAADRRVGHVVLLSGLDVDLASPFCYAYTNGDTELRLRASGLRHSIARAGLFAEFFLGLVHQMGADGTVALPAGDARVSLVARDAVADRLAELALGEPADGHVDVTGPESPTVAEVVTGAGYRFADATPAEFASELLRRGEEPWWVYAYTSMFASIREGRWRG